VIALLTSAGRDLNQPGVVVAMAQPTSVCAVVGTAVWRTDSTEAGKVGIPERRESSEFRFPESVKEG
jgi:hypothetical protein